VVAHPLQSLCTCVSQRTVKKDCTVNKAFRKGHSFLTIATTTLSSTNQFNIPTPSKQHELLYQQQPQVGFCIRHDTNPPPPVSPAPAPTNAIPHLEQPITNTPPALAMPILHHLLRHSPKLAIQHHNSVRTTSAVGATTTPHTSAWPPSPARPAADIAPCRWKSIRPCVNDRSAANYCPSRQGTRARSILGRLRCSSLRRR
jgi:hypothetical protein